MRIKASKFQVLYRYFPDRPWGTENGILRTLNISGRPVKDLPSSLYADIGRLIAPDYHKRLNREAYASKNRGLSRRKTVEVQKPEETEDLKEAEAFLSKLGPAGAGDNGLTQSSESIPDSIKNQEIAPESIEIIEVNQETVITSEVFPAFFVCEKCNRYYYLDKTADNKLECDRHEGPPAPLHQVGTVFSCARCANIEPLLPFSTQLRELNPGTVKCRNGHDITLDLSGKSLSQARWGCVEPTCDYWKGDNNVDRTRVTRQCYCNIDTPDEISYHESKASVMAPRYANNGDIANPLIASYIKDSEGNDLRLDGLRKLHKDTAGSFTFASIEANARSILQELGVSEFFSVSDIQTMTINYGYRSLIHSTPDVQESERYAKFYQPYRGVERFRAFMVSVVGKGLAIGFDKERLKQIMQGYNQSSAEPSYSQRVNNELQLIKGISFRDLLEADSKKTLFPVTKTLHAIEHSLLSSLVQEIGIEDFDSRILVEDGAIVIFETRNLEDGGIFQLSHQPGLIYSWINRAIDKIRNCPQLCNDACMACVRSDNASCHGFLNREFPRWMPPNVLIDRQIVSDWFKSE